MTLVESWRLLSECMLQEEMQPAPEPRSRPVGKWHALFSGHPRPLLLPAHHRRARRSGVRFFMPHPWRRLYASVRLQAHDLLGERARLPLLALPPAIAPTLSDQLGITESPQLAFLIGTPGPYQKAAMLVMSVHGQPLALVKIALREQANDMVATEAAWLRQLQADPVLKRNVPTVLKEGVSVNGFRYFAQSIVPGRPDGGAFTAAHGDFLRGLGAIDCRLGKFADAPIYAQLQEQFLQLAPSLSVERIQLLTAVLKDCTQSLADWFGPFVLSHGDFAYWNIKLRDDGISVFDWEYTMAGAPPLFDLLHYHLIGPATSSRLLGHRDMKRALAEARSFALLSYPEFEWQPRTVGAFGLAYLAHTLLFYGISRGEFVESHPVVRSYCHLLETRRSWLP